MTPELKALLERLTGAAEKLETGETVTKAATTPVADPTKPADPANPTVVVTKGNPDAAPAFAGHSLQTSFETLSKAAPHFRHLEASAVAQDPRTYLRQKDATGQYVVKDHQLEDMIETLLVAGKDGKGGISMHEWLNSTNKGATELALAGMAQKGGAFGETISRALDVTSGGPLIRVDLEPLLYEAYLRSFPAVEAIRSIPANGILHSYDQVTDPGTATVITELGDMSAAFSNSTFVRKQSTNIAVIVAPRAISLKLQFAVSQSGMNFPLAGQSNLELVGAMRAMARKKQSLLLQGNQTEAAGTLSTEDGLYDANAFNGLRTQLKAAGTSITKGGSQTYTDVIDQAVAQIINDGGDQENVLIFVSLGVRRAFNKEQLAMLRLINSEFVNQTQNNFAANGIVTVSDWIARMLNIPAKAQADGLGYYTFSAAATEDGYALDPNGLQFAYLGSPTPTILELPVGFNNQLSNVYYPFEMAGLVVRVLPFNRKIRFAQQTV